MNTQMNITNNFHINDSQVHFGAINQGRQMGNDGVIPHWMQSQINQGHIGDALLDNMHNISADEWSILSDVMGQLGGDGHVSNKDAQTMVDLINEYGEHGAGAFAGIEAFQDLNMSNAPGNAAFNGMAGQAASMVGAARDDQAFLGVMESLLGNGKQNAWSGALEGALEKADLSKLSGFERSQLVAMTSMAARDGGISYPEANLILDKLNDALSNVDQPPLPTPVEPSPSDWNIEQTGDGTATLDIGNYTLDLNEHNSEMILTNKETGEETKIWGDPHFDIGNDGSVDMDFWGTMSLNLEDGTKITIETTPWNNDPNMTLSSRLVITQGDQAIEVSGLDQNTIGDMQFKTSSDNGAIIDAVTNDGLNIYENNMGDGWQIPDGLWMRDVTQEDMNTTKTAGAENENQGFDLLGALRDIAKTGLTITIPPFGMLNALLDS